jgi:two-component system chemotaxis sensor kinase CheA
MADQDLPDLSMFLNDYLNDAKEDFQVANHALLALEKDPSQTERLNEIFRAVHTLKSSSAMLQFTSITELAHYTEDVLDRIRSKELPLIQSTLDILLEAVDTLQTMVKERAAGKSEQEQAQGAAARLEALKQKVGVLESQELLARQGVIAIDERGIIEFFNPAAERLFGYKAEEIVGQKLNVLMPEPYKSQQESYLDNYLRTGKAKVIGFGREVSGLRKDGSTFSLELAVNEMRLGDRRLFLGMVREITRRKAKIAGAFSIETTQTIRVHVELLDSLFNLVGELIITKNRLDTLLSSGAGKELKAALGTMDRLVNQMQEDVSAARLVPVDEIFQKFPRMVRDLAVEQHKEIDLVLEGRQIELDKAVLDTIGEPLVHLLRNAVDHGMEPPEERQRRHKPRRGIIRLAARRAENLIVIEVADDGAGIDSARVKQLALGKGIITSAEAETLSEKDLLNLIFVPGFSSAREVTELSGRGVGLDVVKTAVERLGGTVTVATQPGEGTRFTLHLPLATAIIQTLMVSVGDHVFAIPSEIVLETLDVKPGDIKAVGKDRVLILRREVIPFIKLNDLLNLPALEATTDVIAVIIHRGEKLLGIGVDTVLDQMENIIKPFDPIAQKLRGFSGGTILGDGRVALLLDIPALL